jgi:TPR repeat protein
MLRGMNVCTHGERVQRHRYGIIYLAILLVSCSLVLPTASFGESWPKYTPSSFHSDLILANGGNVTSQLSVAKAYYAGTTGTPGKRNYGQAAYFFQAAANQGSAEAQAWLGSMYMHGHGVVRNLTTALNLIQSSANSNNPVGLRFLALMYQGGQGVTRSYAEAVTLFNRAAALNDGVSCDRLGNLYLRGLGAARNVTTAINMFNQGINLGDSWSQLHLGELYAQGVAPLAKNQATALNYYTQSASKGNYQAAYRAAVGYETGTGATQNYVTAWSYYEQSAIAGYAPAQRAVGRFYQNGLGGKSVDYEHAYVWYSLAAEQGDNLVGSLLAALLKLMTPAQIQAAQTIINNWENNRGGIGSPGSGSVTVTGTERSRPVTHCTRAGCFTVTVYDFGTVSITVNGFTKSVTYSSTSTPTTIAAALANALNIDQNSPVRGSPNGTLLTLFAKGMGTATDYSLSATSATSDPTYFTGSSFAAAVSGSSLTGGQ